MNSEEILSKTDDLEFAIRSFQHVPYWINCMSHYKDAGIALLSNIAGKDIMLADAMEAQGVPYLDFSPIGRVYKVVSDWLYEDQSLIPLTKTEIARSDRNSYAEKMVAQYCMRQPSVDKNAFGAPLILTTLFNSTSLNDYLIEVKEKGLDEDETFKADLRDLVDSRQSALTAKYEFGEKSEPYSAAKTQYGRSQETLLEFLLGPSNQTIALGTPSVA